MFKGILRSEGVQEQEHAPFQHRPSRRHACSPQSSPLPRSRRKPGKLSEAVRKRHSPNPADRITSYNVGSSISFASPLGSCCHGITAGMSTSMPIMKTIARTIPASRVYSSKVLSFSFQSRPPHPLVPRHPTPSCRQSSLSSCPLADSTFYSLYWSIEKLLPVLGASTSKFFAQLGPIAHLESIWVLASSSMDCTETIRATDISCTQQVSSVELPLVSVVLAAASIDYGGTSIPVCTSSFPSNHIIGELKGGKCSV